MTGSATVGVIVVPTARQTTQATAEMLGEARRVAGASGRVVALIIGGDHAKLAGELGPQGADEVVGIEDPAGTYHPERYARLVALGLDDLDLDLDLVVFAGTVLGRDLGARVAAELGCRFHGGCVNFELSGAALRVTRPVELGRLHQVELSERGPHLVALIPDTVGASAPDPRKRADVRLSDVVAADDDRVALHDAGFTAADPRTMDLVDADVIVAGGRGVGSAEGFALLEELADRLGGAVGASRPAVEAGWAPYERQVGQTGRTVRPKLYFACGISGATQHLAGMRDAETIIAINSDPGAPILPVATLAVEGDLRDVLGALLETLRARTGRAAA